MNVTLQTNNFNPQYKNNYNNQYKANAVYNYQPAFKGINDIPAKSNFLTPLKKVYNKFVTKPLGNLFDKFTTGIAKYYTTKMYTSGLADFLASKTEKLDSVVDHMQVLGSVIISGMYMIQTLRNKDLDEDRRRTLAVNQGLTFALSTLGSYTIDRSLDDWWEKITVKYASKQTGDKDLANKIKVINDEIIAKYNKQFESGKAPKGKGPKLVNTLKYIEDNMPDTMLESKLRGMGVLKKLIIFGTVYRFLSPVLVTPFANMIGDKFASHNADKKQQTEAKKAA